MTVLALEMVTSDAGLAALAPEWDSLWHRARMATPFQSPHWLLPWWRSFGTSRPVVATLRAGERLAGILPLYVLQTPEASKLLPIGVGVSDYFDILLEPGLPDDTATVLLGHALHAGLAAGVEVCDLPGLPPEATLLTLPSFAGWRGCRNATEPCPVLLPDAIPVRQRRKLRMNANRADRLGHWGVEFATAGSLPAMLQALLAMNARRWGALDGAAREFHCNAAPGLLASGLLRLGQLKCGEEIAACCYALSDNAHRLMFYMIGFNPDFAAISPGSLLIGAMLDAAVADGCEEVHFLRGDEAYKYAWGAQNRQLAAWRLLPT